MSAKNRALIGKALGVQVLNVNEIADVIEAVASEAAVASSDQVVTNAANTYATKANPQITGDAFIGTEKANQLVLKGSAAGTPASVNAVGSDINIDLFLSAKGIGSVQIPTRVVMYSGLILVGLPTAATGLPSGAVWRNGTALNMVP